MTNELISTILTNVLPPVATGFGAWFFARRKNAAEAEASELENVERAISIYRSIAEDLKKEIGELREQINKLQHQNRDLLTQIEQYRSETADWRTKFLRLEAKLNELKK